MMASDGEPVTRTRLLRAFAVGAMLMLSCCNPPTEQPEDQSLKIQQLERDVAKRDAEIAALKELLLEDRLKPKQQAPAMDMEIPNPSRANPDQADPIALSPPSRYPSMCYKDYCPCEGPQGGPDKVLCDQLEQGKDPSVELMMTGRKLREERRQMDSS